MQRRDHERSRAHTIKDWLSRWWQRRLSMVREDMADPFRSDAKGDGPGVW